MSKTRLHSTWSLLLEYLMHEYILDQIYPCLPCSQFRQVYTK